MVITRNAQKGTFTIEKNGTTYETVSLSNLEFSEMEYYTENDWKDFLRTQDGSYIIKD
jgi:hypothetical protein